MGCLLRVLGVERGREHEQGREPQDGQLRDVCNRAYCIRAGQGGPDTGFSEPNVGGP